MSVCLNAIMQINKCKPFVSGLVTNFSTSVRYHSVYIEMIRPPGSPKARFKSELRFDPTSNTAEILLDLQGKLFLFFTIILFTFFYLVV